MSKKTYTQEFDQDNGNHRIVCSDGRKSYWAHYAAYAYLDDQVSATGYYMDKEGLYSADEFLSRTGVGLDDRNEDEDSPVMHESMDEEINDSPELQNCDDAGTGEGRFHGRM